VSESVLGDRAPGDPATGAARAAQAAREATTEIPSQPRTATLPEAFLAWRTTGGGERILPVRTDAATVFGRGKQADVTINSSYLSLRHFAFLPREDGSHLLMDLGSRNWTYVNGSPVTVTALEDGDQIRIGERTVRYVVSGAGRKPRCSACEAELVRADGPPLCMVCQYRYETVGTSVGGFDVIRPLAERPGLIDYEGRNPKAGRLARLRLFDPGVAVREAGPLVSFDHLGFVDTFGRGKSGKQIYIATELPQRVSLVDLMRADFELPVGLAFVLMREVGEAMAAAHRKGFLHGDLRPARIGIRPQGKPAIDDLGVVDALGVDSVEQDWHLPPESRSGRKKATRHDDLYAFGAAFYAAFSGGRRPSGSSLRSDGGPTQPLKALRPEVPVRLSALFDRILAGSPSDRLPTFDAILAELARPM